MLQKERLQLLSILREPFVSFKVTVIERHEKISEIDQRHLGTASSRAFGSDFDKPFVERGFARAAGKG